MALRDRVFSPFEEPKDPYGLNEYGLDPVGMVFGLIPLIGLSSIFAEFVYILLDFGENEFNMANRAFDTAIVIFHIQIVEIALLLIVFGVL